MATKQEILDYVKQTTYNSNVNVLEPMLENLDGGSGSVIDTVTTLANGGTSHSIQAVEVSGTKNITENGTYDVTNFVTAEVETDSIEYGTFTISSPTWYDQNYTSFFTVAEVRRNVNEFTPPIAVCVHATEHGILGRCPIAEDGYMYVTVVGESDYHSPELTAISGIVEEVLYVGENTRLTIKDTEPNNNDASLFHPFAYVCYKVSPNAVVELTNVDRH